nr:hypothetical protein [Roseiconus nitratireducens]
MTSFKELIDGKATSQIEKGQPRSPSGERESTQGETKEDQNLIPTPTRLFRDVRRAKN